MSTDFATVSSENSSDESILNACLEESMVGLSSESCAPLSLPPAPTEMNLGNILSQFAPGIMKILSTNQQSPSKTWSPEEKEAIMKTVNQKKEELLSSKVPTEASQIGNLLAKCLHNHPEGPVTLESLLGNLGNMLSHLSSEEHDIVTKLMHDKGNAFNNMNVEEAYKLAKCSSGMPIVKSDPTNIDPLSTLVRSFANVLSNKSSSSLASNSQPAVHVSPSPETSLDVNGLIKTVLPIVAHMIMSRLSDSKSEKVVSCPLKKESMLSMMDAICEASTSKSEKVVSCPLKKESMLSMMDAICEASTSANHMDEKLQAICFVDKMHSMYRMMYRLSCEDESDKYTALKMKMNDDMISKQFMNVTKQLTK